MRRTLVMIFLAVMLAAGSSGCVAKPSATKVQSAGEDVLLGLLSYDEIESPAFSPDSYREFEISAGSWAVGGSGEVVGIVSAPIGAGAAVGIGVLDSSTGEMVEPAPSRQGSSEMTVHSARVSDAAIAWLEMDEAQVSWTLYLAPVTRNPLVLGTPVVVSSDHGGAFAVPGFDLAEGTLYWTQSASGALSSLNPANLMASKIESSSASTSGTVVYSRPAGWFDSVSCSSGRIALAARIPGEDSVIDNKLIVLDDIDFRELGTRPLEKNASIAYIVYSEGVFAWVGEYESPSGPSAVEVIGTPKDLEAILAKTSGTVAIVGTAVYASDGSDVWCYLPDQKQRYRMPRMFADPSAVEDVATSGWAPDRLVAHGVEKAGQDGSSSSVRVRIYSF